MKAKGRKHSIMRRMWIPLSFVMILQSVLFGGSILWGGTIDRLEQNSFEILNERVTNRKNYLENEMVQRWSDLAAAETLINQKVSNMLEQNQAAYSALTAEEEWTSELLELISLDLLHLMRRNSVTGAFVVFDGETGFSAPQSGQAAAYSGVHFRDTDPVSTPSDYSDIMMERGISRISKALGIPLDIFWTPQFCLDNSDKTYYEPFLAALKYPSVDSSDLGYWSLPFAIDENDIKIITYSQPLLTPGGEPYGVLGIELTVDYLRKQMPFEELNAENSACYALAVDMDSADGRIISW